MLPRTLSTPRAQRLPASLSLLRGAAVEPADRYNQGQEKKGGQVENANLAPNTLILPLDAGFSTAGIHSNMGATDDKSDEYYRLWAKLE